MLEVILGLPWREIGEGLGVFCATMAAASTQFKSGGKWYHSVMDIAALNFGKAKNDPEVN